MQVDIWSQESRVTHLCSLAFASLGTHDQEAGLAAHGSGDSACMALHQVFCLVTPQGVQDSRDDKRLACEAVRMAPG